MLRQTFKAGHAGPVFGTIGALDTALWDIKAKAGRRTALAAARRAGPPCPRLRLRPRHRPDRRRTGRGVRGLRRARPARRQAQGRPRHRARPAPAVPGARRADRGGPRTAARPHARRERGVVAQAGRPARRRAGAHLGSDLDRGARPAVGRRGPGRRRSGRPGLGRHRREPHRARAVPAADRPRVRSTSSRWPRSGASPTSCGWPPWHTPTTCRSARSATSRSGCCTPRRRCRTTWSASCRICGRRSGIGLDLHIEDGAFVLGDTPGLGIRVDEAAITAAGHRPGGPTADSPNVRPERAGQRLLAETGNAPATSPVRVGALISGALPSQNDVAPLRH